MTYVYDQTTGPDKIRGVIKFEQSHVVILVEG